MRTTTKRRTRQLALVTLAAPVTAWALERSLVLMTGLRDGPTVSQRR